MRSVHNVCPSTTLRPHYFCSLDYFTRRYEHTATMAQGSRFSESDATTEWIQSALQEYEQIASLCNAQTLLINDVVSLSPTSSAGDEDDSVGDDVLDLATTKRDLQHRNLYDHLSRYYNEIDIVRKTHAAMKLQLLHISNMKNDGTRNEEHLRGGVLRCPSPMMVEAMKRHIALSERVIRTVMKSSSISGQCGVLFENGIVRNSSSSATMISDHEVNVVALASLRASVSQLRAHNIGGDGRI